MVRRLSWTRGERAIVSAAIADSDRNLGRRARFPVDRRESPIARGTSIRSFRWLLPARTRSWTWSRSGGVLLEGAPGIEIQIRKAGVRLARVLNETLGR